MEFQQLKYFQTLAVICNVTKAANELNLSQPALSRSILRLEEEIGARLFERKGHGVALNRYGEIFLNHVNQAIGQMDKAKREINDLIDPSHGTILLSFIQPLGSSFVPDLIYEFQKQEAGIRFHLTQNTTNEILRQIESAEIDFGFCAPQEPFDHFNCLPVMNQELYLIVPKDHRLAGREQVELCEVAQDSFVLYKPETVLHDIVEKLCQDAGFQPKMSFEAYEERTVAGLVGAKFGVAIIPALPGLDLQKISLIPIRNPVSAIVIQMVWRANGYLSPAATNFKSYVESRVTLTR